MRLLPRLVRLGFVLAGLVLVGGCDRDAPELPAYSAAEIRSLEDQAGHGDAEAAFLRGVIEQQGLGVTANPAGATHWFQQASERGHARAEISLGLLHATGDGVPTNAEEAVRWFRRAAERGRADAQFYLAGHYRRGEGIGQDKIEALRWLFLSEKGEPHIKQASLEVLDLVKEMTPDAIAEARKRANAGIVTAAATATATAVTSPSARGR